MVSFIVVNCLRVFVPEVFGGTAGDGTFAAVVRSILPNTRFRCGLWGVTALYFDVRMADDLQPGIRQTLHIQQLQNVDVIGELGHIVRQRHHLAPAHILPNMNRLSADRGVIIVLPWVDCGLAAGRRQNSTRIRRWVVEPAQVHLSDLTGGYQVNDHPVIEARQDELGAGPIGVPNVGAGSGQRFRPACRIVGSGTQAVAGNLTGQG